MELLSSVVQYQSKTAGRDSICRLFQYTAKLIGHLLTKENPKNDLIKRLKQLEIALSTSRKTFRVGKSIDMVQGAFKANVINDSSLKCLIILSRLSRALYFYYDMLSWAAKVSILSSDAKKYSLKSAPYWSLAVLTCIARDMYELKLMLKYRSKTNKKNGSLIEMVKNRPELLCDALKNVFDLFIALQLWGKIDVSQGTVGFCGMVSSFVAIAQIIRPQLKLTPN